ncbi:MAG TPA: hypothetical protein VGF07_01170 [Stellaceae bacterium]|jgi:hypothetical protein
MRVLCLVVAACGLVGLLSWPAAASIVEYDYTGQPFAVGSGQPPSVTHLSGNFRIDFSALFPPTTPDDNITSLVKSFSFTDGNQTLTNLNTPNFTFEATFNSTGKLIGPWDIEIGDTSNGPGMSIFALSADQCNDTTRGANGYFATIQCFPGVDNRGTWTGPISLGAPPPVPEPPSFALLAGGIVLFGLGRGCAAPLRKWRLSALP